MVGDGSRVIDRGGIIEPEEPYFGQVLVIFAVDPGVTTGWSALKVPVGLLAGLGAARTLVRCRHRHGQIQRSGGVRVSGGGGSYSNTDSQHVTDILSTAKQVYNEWMPLWTDCAKCEGGGLPRFGQHPESIGDVCERCEGDGGAWDVDDPDQYRFVFALEGFDLRESSMDPSLLAPVRVNSIFMDRLVQSQSEMRVFFQSASDAKNTCNDERLRRWGFYDRSSGAHARDADRHAILLLRRFAADRDLRVRVFGFDPFAAPVVG